jgi:flagellar assembly factor FliW
MNSIKVPEEADLQSELTTDVPLHFLEPLPGIGTYQDYSIEPLKGASGVFVIEPVPDTPTDWKPRLFLVDPTIFAPHYAPKIPASATAALNTTTPIMLLVANPNGHDESTPVTVNLLAPIVANPERHTALQIILDHSTGYGVAVPLTGS